MAQVFPLNVDDLSADEAGVSLAGTLAALPDPWTLLRHRRIGDDQAEPIEVVLVHPEIGVALVDEAPRDPAPSARRLREYLDGQRFGEFFPGELPIVALSVAVDEFEMLGERLAAAFEAAPRLSVADADWADAVIELLMVPDDLAMAPIGDTEAPRMPEHAPTRRERFDGPERARFNEAPDARSDEMSDEPVLHHERFDTTPRERFDELSSEPVRRERFDDAPRDRYSRSPSLDGDEPPLPLMVDWPFAASYRRRRRRGRIAALAVILLVLAGAGVAAWEYAGEDLTVAINDATPPAQDNAGSQDNASRSIEVPLPSQSSGARSAHTAANPAPSAPPPVPAAPPVVMAQKPYAAPPPSPPKPTPVAPLPQVAETKPPSPPLAAKPPSAAPAQTAKADDSGKAQTSAPPQNEPEKTQTASAPPPPPPEKPATQTAEAPTPPAAKPTAAPSPAKPKATRTAKAEPPPPRRVEPARHAPSAVSRPHPSEPSDNPPIDVTDLPPLDEAPAPQRPTELATPNGSSQPPVNGLGPPVPLWRSQQASNNPPPSQTAAAATPASADAGNRECRPYTSSTTLTGRGLRVEGIACRGNDGRWRLVSEVPLR